MRVLLRVTPIHWPSRQNDATSLIRIQHILAQVTQENIPLNFVESNPSDDPTSHKKFTMNMALSSLLMLVFANIDDHYIIKQV